MATTPDGVDAYTLAQRFGLVDVADLLRNTCATTPLSKEEEFIAACARGDKAGARRIQSERPDLPGALPEKKLRLLPALAALGCVGAVKLMVELGWSIAVRGGDWNASALNHGVFRGDAALTRFLLERGASWMDQHGHGDNASGTLSWAPRNEPVDGGNWLGCAEALLAHGMPSAQPDPGGPGTAIINGHRRWLSDDVTEFLLSASNADA